MSPLPIEGMKEKRHGVFGRVVLALLVLGGTAAGVFICTRPSSTKKKVDVTNRRGGSGTASAETPVLPQWRPSRATQSKETVRPSPYSAGIWRRVEALEDQLVRWRRHLHRRPELANRETKTAAYVASVLKGFGLDVRTSVALTGVVGILKGARPGPAVALLAAMDGVPIRERNNTSYASKVQAHFGGKTVWVSHVAGRDVDVTVLLGTAAVLSKLRSVLPGTVVFLFQPAGEGPPSGEVGGAKVMIRQGVLAHPRVEALFAIHPDPSLSVGKVGVPQMRWWSGSTTFRLQVTRRAFAACSGQGGCADPVLAAAQIIVALQAQVARQVSVPDGARVTVSGLNARATPGRMPVHVTLSGALFWRSAAIRGQAVAAMRRTARGIAASAGVSVQIKLGRGKATVHSDPALTRWLLPTLRRALGRTGVVLLGHGDSMASGFVAFRRRVPAVLMRLGTNSAKLGGVRRLYGPSFDVDEECLSVAVHVLANVALDYLLSRPSGHGGGRSESPVRGRLKNPSVRAAPTAPVMGVKPRHPRVFAPDRTR